MCSFHIMLKKWNECWRGKPVAGWIVGNHRIWCLPSCIYCIYRGRYIQYMLYTAGDTRSDHCRQPAGRSPFLLPPLYADLLCNIYTHEAGTDKCHRSLTRHPCVEAESRDRGTARIIIFCCHSYYILCTGGLFGVYFYKFGMRTSSAFTNDRCILLWPSAPSSGWKAV